MPTGKSKFKWPKAWSNQQRLENGTMLAFSKMLPGCLGFIAENGEIVMYGQDYKSKLLEGRISN